MNKPQRNPGEMFLIIEQWEESNLTQDEYCQSKGIPKSTFYYWRKKLREERSSNQDPFIPVTIRKDNETNPVRTVLTISYPNGVQINLSGRPSIDYIRDLIRIY